jgi:hypothetical protein
MDKKRALRGLGINVVIKHFTHQALDKYIEAITDLDFRWVRLLIDFQEYLRKNAWDWEPYDYFVDQCRKYKIPVLGSPFPNVSGTIGNLIFPERNNLPAMQTVAEYQKFVAECICRWGNHIDLWEIWNEPNYRRFWITPPNPAEYVSLLRETAQTIKSLQPKAEIVIGGIIAQDGIQIFGFPRRQFGEMDYYKKILELGAAGLFDFANFHPYPADSYFSFRSLSYFLDTISHRIEQIVKTALEISPGHPVIISEFGISPTLTFRLNQNDIAQIYWSCIKTCNKLESPFALWTLTDFNDPFYSRWNPEKSFGLLTYDLEPKPVYKKLKELLKVK